MDFLKFAKDRYSVRNFKRDNISKETLDKILEAGHIAPTGCNNQPQRILVLSHADSMAKLAKCTKYHFDAPNAMIVCYSQDESWVRKYDGAMSAPVDASIVTTHMMLQAHNMGIGTCWVMHFDPFKMRTHFNVPENFEISALLVMGYPHKDASPLKLHSQYRDTDEVVYYDTF